MEPYIFTGLSLCIIAQRRESVLGFESLPREQYRHTRKLPALIVVERPMTSVHFMSFGISHTTSELIEKRKELGVKKRYES